MHLLAISFTNGLNRGRKMNLSADYRRKECCECDKCQISVTESAKKRLSYPRLARGVTCLEHYTLDTDRQLSLFAS